MAGAGYSGTPLAKKLGIREHDRVAILGAPPGIREALEPLPAGVRVTTSARGTLDVVIAFHASRDELEAHVPVLLSVMDVDGAIWAAWPKRSSGVATDLTEDVHREVFLPLGLVDTKVCAVDDTWSGLRVCWRRELRDDVRAGLWPRR